MKIRVILSLKRNIAMLPLIPSPLVLRQIDQIHEHLLNGWSVEPHLTLPIEEDFLKNAAERYSREMTYSEFFTYLCVSYVLKRTPHYIFPSEKKAVFEKAASIILENPGKHISILQKYRGKVPLILDSLNATKMRTFLETSQKIQNFIMNGNASHQEKLILAEQLHQEQPLPPDRLIDLMHHILPTEPPQDKMELYDWLLTALEVHSMDTDRGSIVKQFYPLFLKMAALDLLEGRHKLIREIAHLTPSFKELDLTPEEKMKCLEYFLDSSAPVNEIWFLESFRYFNLIDKGLSALICMHILVYLKESKINRTTVHPILQRSEEILSDLTLSHTQPGSLHESVNPPEALRWLHEQLL
jgi:hypothetical protein